jgi:hypothetical protein
MLVVGVGALWAAIFLIPTAQRLGLSARAANRIPLFGFAGGAAIAVGIHRARGVKEVVGYIIVPFVLGAVGWFLGLAVGAVLMVFGASEAFVDPFPTVGFGLGVAVGIVPLFAGGLDLYDRLRRRGSKPRL